MRPHTGLMVLLTLMAASAQAAPVCKPSASMKAYDYPGARVIPTGNNLILPAGKAVAAEGQPLVIRGRVLDSRCAPVPEAVVELWQASPYGRYLLAEGADLASARPVFAGAGRTYTDSDGSFTFTTAFPAPSRYRAPNVNVRVKAERMPTYTSALFFSGDVRNDADAAYRKATARQSTTITMNQSAEGMLTGTIDIILPGKAPYRSY